MSLMLALFVLVAVAMSLFHGVYAVTIWLSGFNLSDEQEGSRRRDSWLRGWKDIFRHPFYFHQFWFNFAGSALGWAAIGYLVWRLLTKPDRFGFAEAGLSLIGAIGIVGYLPSMLHKTVNAVDTAVDAVKRLGGAR
jgi:hypothetical protein